MSTSTINVKSLLPRVCIDTAQHQVATGYTKCAQGHDLRTYTVDDLVPIMQAIADAQPEFDMNKIVQAILADPLFLAKLAGFAKDGHTHAPTTAPAHRHGASEIDLLK